MVSHPLFRYMDKNSVPMMKKICSNALVFYNFSQGDVLFSPGEIPTCQVLLSHTGECRYTIGDKIAIGSKDNDLIIEPGRWICEQALWTSWVYRGLLRAIADCQMMVVSGEVLMQINAQSQHLDLAAYGQLYVKELTIKGRACSDLADEIEGLALVAKAFSTEEAPLKSMSMRAQASVRGSMLSFSAFFPSR